MRLVMAVTFRIFKDGDIEKISNSLGKSKYEYLVLILCCEILARNSIVARVYYFIVHFMEASSPQLTVGGFSSFLVF